MYYLGQAGRGQYETWIGPMYPTPAFLQRGHGIGIVFGSFFRWVKTVLWKGAKAFGRETLRTRFKILSNIAENRSPEVRAGDIISRQVTECTRNLISKLYGRGRKRVKIPHLNTSGNLLKSQSMKKGHFLLTYISRCPVISEETVSISSEVDVSRACRFKWRYSKRLK